MRKAVDANLAAFERAGLILRSYAHIRVLAPERLRQVAAARRSAEQLHRRCERFKNGVGEV